MRLTKDQILAGLPAVEVRAALRHFHDNPVDAHSLAWALGRPEADGPDLMKAFVAEGLLEPGDRGFHTMTLRGGAVANASFAKPVRRDLADRHIRTFLERVEEINGDPGYVLWIPRVVLFGSTLADDNAPVGDIDLAVEYADRYPDDDTEARLERRTVRARASGRRFSSFFDQMSWFSTEVRLRLKNRDALLSITDTDDKVLDQAPHREIYRRESPARS